MNWKPYNPNTTQTVQVAKPLSLLSRITAAKLNEANEQLKVLENDHLIRPRAIALAQKKVDTLSKIFNWAHK